MTEINIRWLPESIVLLICDYLTDADKLYFALVSKNYHKLLDKFFFDTKLSLEKLLKIPYKNQFRSVEVTPEEIKYLITEKLTNLTCVVVSCNFCDHFDSEHAEIIKILKIQELIFRSGHERDNFKIKCKIPETVKILKLYDNVICDSDKFPSYLDALFFDNNSSTQYENLILPQNLTRIHNLNLDTYETPTENEELDKKILPTTVTHLKLINTRKITPNVIPLSVTHLSLSHWYNRKISSNIIPSNLTYLNFTDSKYFSSFNEQINIEILPQTLTVLKFCTSYNRSPDFIYELKNLICLKFYGSGRNALDFSKISKSITHLSTNIYSAKNKICSNVINLSIASHIADDILDYLPKNLEKIKIIVHAKTNQTITKNIPSTINSVTLQPADHHNYDRDNNKIIMFVDNIPCTVKTLKIIKFNLTTIVSLPNNIINFKIRGCTIKNMLFIHEKIIKLSVPIDIKKIISDKIKRQARIKYYKN